MIICAVSFSLLALSSSNVVAQANQTIPPNAALQPLARIGKIIIIGNKTLNAETIIAYSGHKIGDPCTDRTIDEIVTNLNKTGYFGEHTTEENAVRVHVEENNPSNGLCNVIIEVDENDTVKSVSISGSGPIKPDDIKKLIHIKPGTVYSYSQFSNDGIDIENLYRQQGYSAVVSDVAFDPNNPGVLNVTILVTRVAEIKITGNRRTKARVILREMKTKVGDYFNVNTLNKDRQRLYNLDLFDEVTPEDRTLGPGRVGLTISVVEKRTGTIGVGVGYSSRQQLVGRAEITDSNFRGMGETLNLIWETGGVVGRSSIELDFTEPWLDNRNTSLSVQLYDKIVYRFANSLNNSFVSTNATDQNYFETHIGATVGFSRPLMQNYRTSFTLRGENVRAENLQLDPNNAIILQSGPIYSVAGTLIHNNRDLDLDPATGGLQSANLELGHANLKPASPLILPGAGVFGSTTYVKPLLDWRQFFSLQGPRPRNKPDAKRSVVALRLMFGSSTGRLPFFEQYFIGGADTLRGYREDRFWGSNTLLSSVELRQPLANALTGVLFLDAGDAWGGDYTGVNIAGFNQSQDFSLHLGIGFGIRVRTPLGPLRLDFGFGSEGGRTHFSIGNVF
jgi:outer membrane protein insertion porin family